VQEIKTLMRGSSTLMCTRMVIFTTHDFVGGSFDYPLPRTHVIQVDGTMSNISYHWCLIID
jgi:hypothetical protein